MTDYIVKHNDDGSITAEDKLKGALDHVRIKCVRVESCDPSDCYYERCYNYEPDPELHDKYMTNLREFLTRKGIY